MRLRVLIASANGYGNIGDDLATLTNRYLIKEVFPSAEVKMTSPPAQLAHIKWADIVVVGGGGLFYDISPPNVENYLVYLRAAQALNKPTMVMGVGTQGIDSDWAKKAYKEVLDKVNLITVRNKGDRNVLVSKVGVTKPVHVVQDPVFLTEKLSTRAVPPRPFGKSGKPLLGVSLMNTQQSEEIMSILKEKRPLWENITKKLDAEFDSLLEHFDVRLLCMSNDDISLYRKWQERHPEIDMVKVNSIVAAPHMLEEYKKVNYVLTSRFHGLILALLARRPVIAMGFAGQKVDRFVKHDLPHIAKSFTTYEDYLKQGTLRSITPEYFNGLPLCKEDELKNLVDDAYKALTVARPALNWARRKAVFNRLTSVLAIEKSVGNLEALAE